MQQYLVDVSLHTSTQKVNLGDTHGSLKSGVWPVPRLDNLVLNQKTKSVNLGLR